MQLCAAAQLLEQKEGCNASLVQHDLFRLCQACVNLSNFSWYVLTMVDPENGTPGGSNQQPLAREELEVLLRDALAATKRNNEEVSEQRRQQACVQKELDSLQQGGLTEEGKEARIAPGITFKEHGCQKAYSRNCSWWRQLRTLSTLLECCSLPTLQVLTLSITSSSFRPVIIKRFLIFSFRFWRVACDGRE